jgi:hypothetical protein
VCEGLLTQFIFFSWVINARWASSRGSHTGKAGEQSTARWGGPGNGREPGAGSPLPRGGRGQSTCTTGERAREYVKVAGCCPFTESPLSLEIVRRPNSTRFVYRFFFSQVFLSVGILCCLSCALFGDSDLKGEKI